MYGVLREIQKRVGADKFPLIPINFYSSHMYALFRSSDHRTV